MYLLICNLYFKSQFYLYFYSVQDRVPLGVALDSHNFILIIYLDLYIKKLNEALWSQVFNQCVLLTNLA